MSAKEPTGDPIQIISEFIPPSLNACYRNVTARDGKKGGRIKTKRYNEWLAAFAWDVKLCAKGKSLPGPYTISIVIDRSSRHRLSDIMNREKPVSDALQSLGIIANDNLCESGTVSWGDLATKGMIVTVWPCRGDRE